MAFQKVWKLPPVAVPSRVCASCKAPSLCPGASIRPLTNADESADEELDADEELGTDEGGSVDGAENEYDEDDEDSKAMRSRTTTTARMPTATPVQMAKRHDSESEHLVPRACERDDGDAQAAGSDDAYEMDVDAPPSPARANCDADDLLHMRRQRRCRRQDHRV